MLLVTLALLASCKPGKIRVVNQVSSVTMYNISWGNHELSGSLLPGQSTDELEISRGDEKLPSSHPIVFEITANGNTVALQTEELYELDRDETLVIVIDDDTGVN